MVDAFRGLLDELMGKERDVPLGKRQNKALEFDDPTVCKYELVALCPNRLFRNTKSDLGSCGFEIHDDHLEWPNIKERWDKMDIREQDRYPYERELLRYLEQLIRDMDAKIARNKERAEAESRPKLVKPDDQKRLDEIKGRQADAVARAAQLGESGDIDGAMDATQQAEALGRQHDALHKTLTEPDRSMTVCDICGVFINSTDNDQRRLTPGELKAREDHLTGKQYLGWKKIRETYAELTKARDERLFAGGAGDPHRSRSRSEDRRERGHSRGAGSRERDGRERGSSRGHHRDERGHDSRGSSRGYGRGEERGYGRERDRDRDYDRRDRDRDRDREYDRRSSRDRERSPGRRSSGGRDRDRDYESSRRSYNEVPPPGYSSREEYR